MQDRLFGYFAWCLITFVLSVPMQSMAARIKLDMSPNLTALAEYRVGKPEKPVVVILHGFLQTHDFPIVFRMTDGLAAMGYTVLAPTLTLGITYRNTSLACEAIHTHTLEDGVEELQQWLVWLRQRHHGPIVLIGHSLGSITMLAYLDRRISPRVSHLIGVSIMEGRIDEKGEARKKHNDDQRARIRDRRPRLVQQPYSFCSSFRATPASLQSYLAWTPDRIRSVSARNKSSITYIMGGRDDRLGSGWIQSLTQTGINLRMIEGANHFMDGEHEFDLLDILNEELRIQR